MQKLVIIRGNSGSGKSTVATQLRKRMGYETMLISQDTVRREILRIQDLPENPCIDLMYDIALYGKKLGFDVVIEGIMTKKRYEKMLMQLASEFQDSTYSYYFDLPFEETLKRHETKPYKDEFGETEMRKWWVEKDFLGMSGEKAIYPGQTADEIVEMIYSDIQ